MSRLKQLLTQASRKKMFWLLLSLVLLVVADGLLTQYLVPSGRAYEGNPFLEPLVGETGFMLLKIGGAVIVALILWDIYRRYPKVAVAATWLALFGYTAIVLWNTSLVILF